MPNTQAVGVAYSDPEFTTCYASQEIGYSAAAQGTVTQLTDKSTAVTLNKSAGRITMNAASLAANTAVTFQLNNNLISTNDTLIVNVSGASIGSLTAPKDYTAYVCGMSSGYATIALRNLNTTTAYSEAVVINFAIIHGA